MSVTQEATQVAKAPLYALWKTAASASSVDKASSDDLQYIACSVFIPGKSFLHQQLWQPLLHPSTIQDIWLVYLLINVLGISHLSPGKRL